MECGGTYVYEIFWRDYRAVFYLHNCRCPDFGWRDLNQYTFDDDDMTYNLFCEMD